MIVRTLLASLAIALVACSSNNEGPNPSDASTDARDAMQDDTDASRDAASDASSDAQAAICNNGPQPLPAKLTCGSGHTSIPAGSPTTWSDVDARCAATRGTLLTTPCGGYLAYVEPRGVDGSFVYLYDATTKALAAILSSASDQFWQCDEGRPDFALDTRECFSSNGISGCAFGAATGHVACVPDGGADGGDAGHDAGDAATK